MEEDVTSVIQQPDVVWNSLQEEFPDLSFINIETPNSPETETSCVHRYLLYIYLLLPT